MEKVISHRCAESLKNHVSIRLVNDSWYGGDVWKIGHATLDFELQREYAIYPITSIRFCPYCGADLTEESTQ